MVGALNFNLLDQGLSARVAGSATGAYQAGQDRDQANMLAQAQLQHTQSQNELSKYTLNAARRTDELQIALDTMMGQGFNPADPTHLAKLPRYGAAGLAVLKGIQEGQLTMAKLDQEKAGTTGKHLENIKKKQEMSAQAMRDLSQRPDNENILSHLRDTLSSEYYTPEEKAGAQAKADQLLALPYEQRASAIGTPGASATDLKPVTSVVDQSGQKSIIQTPSYGGKPMVQGTYADVPLPAAVQAQKQSLARSGAARMTVNQVGESQYAKEVGGGAGKEDVATYGDMQKLPADMTKLRETLDVLKKSDINTGLGAELFTVLDKARSQFLADKKAGVRATGTEYLDSLLGSAVFPQIQALGIGSKGMDTPAEREFLRKVMTGSISLNKDTLVKMTELRAKGLTEQANRFNKRVQNGEMDNFFKASGRKPSLINLEGAAPAASVESQIPTATPIYATNGKQRIVSTDGGNTWAPAR